jgi:hypothetical protein
MAFLSQCQSQDKTHLTRVSKIPAKVLVRRSKRAHSSHVIRLSSRIAASRHLRRLQIPLHAPWLS